MTRALAALALLPWFTGCGAPAQSCVPGAQVACACADGSDSVQVCNAEGTGLGTCDCESTTDDTTDTDVAVEDTDVLDTDVTDTDAGCTEITAQQLEVLTYDTLAAGWQGTFTPDLGDHGAQLIRLGFFSGIEPALVGTFDLGSGHQINYQSCALCVSAESNTAAGQLAHSYFQRSGTLRLDINPVDASRLLGRLSNVVLEEVEIDFGTYLSTPVPGGSCLKITSLDLDVGIAPAAWTCGEETYKDGAICDCECGAYDPDCALQNAPLDGCASSGEVCVVQTCRPAAANATCASATPLSLGAPVIGNNMYGGNNYDLGFEDAECTGYPQPGPDVAYAITLSAGQQIHLVLQPGDPSLDISMEIVGPGDASVCDALPVDCLIGSDNPAQGESETVDFTAPSAGTYYVVVDTWQDGGAFTLTATAP